MAPSLDVMAFNQQALDFAGVLLSDIVVSIFLPVVFMWSMFTSSEWRISEECVGIVYQL